MDECGAERWLILHGRERCGVLPDGKGCLGGRRGCKLGEGRGGCI